MGLADTGALWRTGYDMKPEAFQAETDRLWAQVKPLYEQLQCYTANKLVAKYGDAGRSQRHDSGAPDRQPVAAGLEQRCGRWSSPTPACRPST